MKEANQVRLCGFGGQGVVLAGTILGYAAINDGKYVAGSNSYGAAARGGSCRSDIVIHKSQIIYPHVIEADVLVAMSQSAYDLCISQVNKKGIVIYDNQLVKPIGKNVIKHVGISANSLAEKKIGNIQAANFIILGMAIGLTNIVSKVSVVAALEQNIEEKFRQANLRAFELGYKLALKQNN